MSAEIEIICSACGVDWDLHRDYRGDLVPCDEARAKAALVERWEGEFD